MSTDTQQAASETRHVVAVFATYTDEKGIVRTAHRGDDVKLTPDEAERLDGLGSVASLDLAGLAEHERQAKLDRYRAERGDADAVAAVARAVAPTDPIPDVSVPQPSVSPPGGGAAPVGNVVTGDTGAPDTPPPPGGPSAIVRVDAPDVGEASVAELAEWITAESPNAADTVALAEGDADRARKVLEAEQSATGGDPRKTVEGPLQKIIDDAE